ncbi:MAG: hypothetical protein C5B51_12625 [Terriglobia bacterium]|nr:MAG: hypothetical protein C5B51_12625 [Terriglobia bacterium]
MRTCLVAVVLGLLTMAALAQRQRFRFGLEGATEGRASSLPAQGEFHFIRVEYTDLPEFHRGYGFGSRNGTGDGWWLVDWPDSDEHFSLGVQRLTRIETGAPLHMRLTDDRLFDHPWLYATQTGWWNLSEQEIARLREYLLRGGFLVTDDFWGEDWGWFQRTMERVLPGMPITDIAQTDLVMHVAYDIEEKDRTFIPGTRHLWRGPGGIIVRQPPGTTPAWRAIHDERNRMLVAVNYNTDVGDAWEYADSPYYPEPMTALAYRYGVNYLIYAMTH